MTLIHTPVPPTTDRPPRRRLRWAAVTAAALVAAGLGAGLGAAFAGSSRLAVTSAGVASPSGTPGTAGTPGTTGTPSATGTPGTAGTPSGESAGSSSGAAPYAYYQSMMQSFLGSSGFGPMMGGAYGWMAGQAGYTWMLGGTGAPQWMTGQSLPGFMMGGSTDPGQVMGQLLAGAPGPRVSAAAATRLGDAVPSGAVADRSANRLTFTSTDVHLAVLASPSMPAENFRIAGMTDPTVVVPEGATVQVELVNADTDMAHGLVVTTSGAASSALPMMQAAPAFAGAALWLLGEATSAGMHEGTFAFTASATGTYQYLCPVPGHAEEGMAGTLVVQSRS